jgi:hypothetical protein
MFTDLFHLVHSLEHDYKEENGERVHAYGCRRCGITTRLNGFKSQILCLLRDIEFAIGEPGWPSLPAEAQWWDSPEGRLSSGPFP